MIADSHDLIAALFAAEYRNAPYVQDFGVQPSSGPELFVVDRLWLANAKKDDKKKEQPPEEEKRKRSREIPGDTSYPSVDSNSDGVITSDEVDRFAREVNRIESEKNGGSRDHYVTDSVNFVDNKGNVTTITTDRETGTTTTTSVNTSSGSADVTVSPPP